MTVTTVCSGAGSIRPCRCGDRQQQQRAASQQRRRDANNVRLGRNSQHWRRLRARRLEMVGHLCELRHPGCTRVATSVHLIGGGDHATATLDQVRAACHRCHGRQDGGKRRKAGFSSQPLTIPCVGHLGRKKTLGLSAYKDTAFDLS